MAVLKAPVRQQSYLTEYDKLLAEQLRQMSGSIGPGDIAAESYGGKFPVGTMTAKILGGVLARAADKRAINREEQAKESYSRAFEIANAMERGNNLSTTGMSVSPEGNLEILPTGAERGGVSTFTRPDILQSQEEIDKLNEIRAKEGNLRSIEGLKGYGSYREKPRIPYVGSEFEATSITPTGIPLAPKNVSLTVGEEIPEDKSAISKFLSGTLPQKVLPTNAEQALSQALRGADVNELEFRDYMQNRMATKQGEEKYESSFIANIFNAEGDNFVGRISEKTITNSDGSKTKIAEIYNPNTNSYIPLTPGFNYSKIADKKNEIQPRYFIYNGEVDIEYTDTDGQTKTLKPNDSFRIEGPNSPQALINLSKTQNAEEKKLVGDKGFASRPLVDINNPGIVVASINGIIGGTGNYEESIQIRENYEIPYKDENNVDQVYTYQAGESINNKDERFMPLLNLLQETTIGNISEMRKAGFISAPKLLEQRNDLLQQGQSINSLINYVDTIDQTSTGINRTIDRVNTWFTSTFMPENQLDENEVALRIANGQLSRLGGTQRVDILGPGVMTEFDFLRLQEALGGEPTSKQSIQAFKRTLKLILEEKMVKYNDSLKVYDAQRTKFGDLRAEVIPPINFEVKEYKSFFEPTDYPSWNTGMIKRIEKGDAIFNQIAEVQKLVGTNATNEDYLKFFNKRQWEEIKARLRLLGIKGVPK